mmetsp:Transcript_19116/g.22790  ORF Transcript_19116/g.22790 Transcript_19116/m.22790 type:complete len:80 (-) Transcript_19116:92-331(-)
MFSFDCSLCTFTNEVPAHKVAYLTRYDSTSTSISKKQKIEMNTTTTPTSSNQNVEDGNINSYVCIMCGHKSPCSTTTLR